MCVCVVGTSTCVLQYYACEKFFLYISVLVRWFFFMMLSLRRLYRVGWMTRMILYVEKRQKGQCCHKCCQELQQIMKIGLSALLGIFVCLLVRSLVCIPLSSCVALVVAWPWLPLAMKLTVCVTWRIPLTHRLQSRIVAPNNRTSVGRHLALPCFWKSGSHRGFVALHHTG